MLMLTLFTAAAVAAPGSKTMAMDDWQPLEILQVGAGSSGPVYLQVQAGDLDGDGLADDAVLKLDCIGGKVASASYAVVPREAGSGMATGKRQHSPLTIVKEWSPASPQLRAIKPSYDIKEAKGSRSAAAEWTPLSLSNSDGLCPAAATVVKSKSNITNN